MALRIFRVNFRLNWVCDPIKCTQFFNNLKADMEDINNDVQSLSFDLESFHEENENIVKLIGKDDRIHWPNL